MLLFVVLLAGVAWSQCPNPSQASGFSCVDSIDPCDETNSATAMYGFDGSTPAKLYKNQYQLSFYNNGQQSNASHLNFGKDIGTCSWQDWQVCPRDTNGAFTGGNKKVVVLGVGMSNANQQFSKLETWFTNGSVRTGTYFVNGAVGGWDACKQAVEDPSGYWSIVQNKVTNAGHNKNQVQVLLIKSSNNRPQTAAGYPTASNQCFNIADKKTFPGHAGTTQGHLHTILKKAKTEFPNLKQAFLIARSFGGWSCDCTDCSEDDTYREPVAMEEGFSVKWQIKKQLEWKPDYRWGANEKLPWMDWGPYLWDKTTGVWNYEQDGIHPAEGMEWWVAAKLYDFLKNNDASTKYIKVP